MSATTIVLLGIATWCLVAFVALAAMTVARRADETSELHRREAAGELRSRRGSPAQDGRGRRPPFRRRHAAPARQGRQAPKTDRAELEPRR